MSDVVCLTRSRWGDTRAGDHPLMSRFARTRRVFLIEPPVGVARSRAFLEEQRGPDGLVLCVPHLPSSLAPELVHDAAIHLLHSLRARHALTTDLLWAERASDLHHARPLAAQLLVWDRRASRQTGAAAESAFAPEAGSRARRLERPDLVLVSNDTIERARADACVRVMAPAIDVAHLPALGEARATDPPDQAQVPGPRIGLAVPLDPRLDVELLAHIATALPDHFVVALGVPQGIDVRTLPCRPNVRWLGEKSAQERVRYVAGWDVAIVPQRDPRGLGRLAAEALALGVPVVASPALALELGPPLFRAVDAARVVAEIELALRAPRAVLARAALRARATFGWDAAFAQLEGWIADARERAAARRRPTLARSSA